jgi:hypothetical protein
LWAVLPTVAHKVDELVRQRPGIISEELREALGRHLPLICSR